ncbi:unnamed protein product [Parnassius apollo]|uniref:(apollo) hypothetical protein n=1 Tax=Parnassius apollo TaxID=110799 RepID=A0A8S3XD05_PARAO|nr:unnamed protein product [Parnassius apollo]
MDGVEHFDHFRSSYPIDRKSRKYWMRLFIFMFDSAVINAYITYNMTHVVTPHSHRNFRLRLTQRSNIDRQYSKIKKEDTLEYQKKSVSSTSVCTCLKNVTHTRGADFAAP